MAHSIKKWELAKALFQVGKSLSEIEKETGISRGQLSKKSKSERWKKETLKNIVEAEVLTTIRQNETEKEKETLSVIEKETVNKEVSEKLKHATLINNVVAYGVSLIGKKMKEDGNELSMHEIKSGIEATDKAAITLGVAQRHANSQVTVNTQTNVQTNNIELSEEEAKQKALELGVPLSALT